MDNRRIGDILRESSLIDESMLTQALEEQESTGERLARILVNSGYLSEKDRLAALSTQFGISFITSSEYPQTPPLIKSKPSAKFLKQYKVLPIEQINGSLKVVVSDPIDPFPVEALKRFTELNVETVLGSEKDILATIELFYGRGAVTMDKIIEGIEEKDMEGTAWESDDIEHLKDLAQEAPIINLVNLLITMAVDKKASDIHIEPFDEGLHIRYRIDGILHQIESLPKGLHPPVASRIKIMARLNIAERRLPQDGRIKFKASASMDIDIRVSTVPTLYGESVVMRLLDPTGIMTMEALGMSSKIEQTFGELIRRPHGMILVTGPTGSGKSTTLYAAFSKIDIKEKKVITIEDPVEYYLEGINQIQVKPKIGFTFANGLRSIVRQDPDVIMVGEIRDSETAEISVHSALTGHLILSTLHTNDAPGAVIRLMDMGVEAYLVSSSLVGVMAQRLVRVICDNCKVTSCKVNEVTQGMTKELQQIIDLRGLDFMTYRGEGCEKCDATGYKGRTGIYELMIVNDDLRKLINERKGADVLRQMATRQGMLSLREAGFEKVMQGVTTIEELARVTVETM